MNIDILKNPILLGILASVLTYLYFWWQEKKRREENPEEEITYQPISIITPLAVGVIIWFASATYFDMTGSNNDSNKVANVDSVTGSSLSDSSTVSVNDKQKMITKSPMVGGSYHFVGKNKIRLPPTDVFLDIAKF